MGPNIQQATARVDAASNYEGGISLEVWPYDADTEFSGRLLIDLWANAALNLDLEIEITPAEARQLAMRLIECAAKAEEGEGKPRLADSDLEAGVGVGVGVDPGNDHTER